MRRKLLIVDDVQTNRAILRRMLCDEYDTLEAADGREALEALEREGETLCAVLLDIHMPVMDGYELLERMQDSARLSNIPVIVTTGNVHETAEIKALDLGAKDFITKPYSAGVIKRRLKNTVRLRETAAVSDALRRDALTGLWNREAFFERAARMIAERPEGFYCLECADINGFRIINDQYGAKRGDEVLQALADALRESCEAEGGICGRISADIFACLCERGLSESGALRPRALESALLERTGIPLTLSTGRYPVDDKSLSISAMYDRARMAQATVKGRYDENTALYNEEMHSRVLREQEIIGEMNSALISGQFEPWYQPKYDHSNGALVGAEALARWIHPQKGLIPPNDFVPLFERSGFIYELDKYMLSRVCAFLRAELDAGRPPVPISVNLSRYDLFRDDLVDTVKSAAASYDVPCELLHLEVTESAFARPSERVISAVTQLAASGFTVEIDDFGTGCSSLNALKDVPAGVLKLDMRFLENDSSHGRGGSILESLVRMAKWLGMAVIAEGVETTQQADFLRSIGCNYIQGYPYARPMPEEEYAALAAEAHSETRPPALETLERLDNAALWEPESMDALIYNSYLGGACIFEYRGGAIELLRVNEKFAEIIGSKLTAEEALKLDWASRLSAESAEAVRRAVERSAAERDEVVGEFVFHDLPGCPAETCLRSTLRVIATAGDRCLVYCVSENITAQREAERRILSFDARLNAIMDNITAGVTASTAGENGAFDFIFANEQYFAMYGYTREQFDSELASPYDVVHPDDVEGVREKVSELFRTREPVSYRYRCVTREGGEIVVRANSTLINLADVSGDVLLSITTDITQIALAEKQLHDTLPLVLSATMKSSTDLAFAKDKDFRYICCSPAFVKFTRQQTESDVIGRTDYDFFTKAEADHFRSDDVKLFESGESLIDYLEPIPSDDGVRRYSVTSKYILRDAAGEIVGLYGCGRDVTEYRVAFERLRLLTDSIEGGIASYVWTPGGIKLTYFNDGFCNLLGCTREEYEQISEGGINSLALPEDVPLVMSQAAALVRDNTPMDCTFRVLTRGADAAVKWVNLRGSFTERIGESVYFNTVMYDVSEQKRAEEALRVHENELTAALGKMGRIIGEYDIAERTLTLPAAYAEQYGIPRVLYGLPQSAKAVRNLDDEGYEAYKEFYDSIVRGEDGRVIEIKTRQANGDARWERMESAVILDSAGTPVRALIMCDNTTEQHIQYELEQNRPSLGEDNLIIHALFNLTTGETLDYSYRDGGTVPTELRTAFTSSRSGLEEHIADPAERESYRELNDPAKLLRRYEEGERELTIDYRRRLADGEATWVRNILRMMPKPGGSDILLFEYCYNIEDEKLRELMYSSLVSEGYDYVVRVNLANGRFVSFPNPKVTRNMPPKRGDSVDEVARELAETNLHPDDREAAVQNITAEGIRRNLADRERFQFTVRELEPDGSVRYKRMTEFYLDRARELALITREDITQLMHEEAEKNALLADALAAANQANQAKSTFLSRMSHELRTPMNAIIGLAALSAGELDNPRAMEDNIAKIGISARYLLSLINDILEMSRIESGRLTLNEAPFDFERFIGDINAIIYPQAADKGVDYDVIINSYLEPDYVGDSTKLQEVLVNVLGNAVKFTNAGGKVTLAIEQLRRAGAHATLRFVVSDTGIGIDSEFIPLLFEPFSQEGAHITSSATGTGLGLSITKSIVEMMNGHISVQSVKNVGSVFTVDVQLGISSESRHYLDMLASMNLSVLRALVVDDDVVVCKSTVEVLKAMGMQTEWVDSGLRAVERVDEAHEEKSDFDTIFIDWKMPDIDGVETTRRIRKIVGPEVTIIIMTAYDFSSIEQLAREAGVDMFMEKPLFQSSVVRAFEKVFSANRSRIESAPSADYDFTGKRILLTDDHPLNVEVAKRLLERKGAEVVVASNGLEALETFATASDGWFDAILMDIRMPVMDGLTATKSIRNLKKHGSREIPIIAMTANAFSEDAELSLNSGMDAHLSKPIEPALLFSTLQRLMKR